MEEGARKWTGTEHMQQIKCSSVHDVKLHMPSSNAPLTENKFLQISLVEMPAFGGGRIFGVWHAPQLHYKILVWS